MPGLKATGLALLAVSALAVSGCNRENPPSTNTQGPPDSAPQPVPTPTGTTGSQLDNAPAGSAAAPASSVAVSTSAANPSDLTLADQNFLTGAATAGLLEVAAARAAAQKATHAGVKAYAGMLLKDHTATNAELRALAAKKQLDLPAEIGAGQAPTLAALTNASGAAFDRMFVQTVVSAHRSDIALFEQAARDARDADVRAFAGKALPKLREHLSAALKLPGASEVGTNAPAGSERKGP
ncbi:DUF4142 domain-containing protein [Schlegelella sp. S2-27]|uniref:DUF4142 domain-containing protein n=1 Tax=Caldimonas mangrovi TaxID=2944811 RepID=A0ABT0YVD0_9BURK|nr:DUF4142 domain-containing protein [Caldimonas mangrovi]MCM5682719.1 DUF4142 domain-containing protein [Caldimonas mangrovi]